MQEVKEFLENNLDHNKLKLTSKRVSFIGTHVPRQDFPKTYADLEKFCAICPGLMEVLTKTGKAISKESKELFEQYFEHVENLGVPKNALKDTFNINEEDLAVLINRKDHDDIRIYDMACEMFLDVNYRTFIRAFPDWSKVQPSVVDFNYNPFSKGKTYIKDLKNCDILSVSTYYPPEWKYKEVEAKVPPQIKKFLHHLFPEKESREYVLDWIYYMTYLRCGTHLVLNGAKGVGKNLFTKLCSSLVGRKNSYSARASVLAQFNRPLEDKRLVLFDEIKVTEANHDRLKELANDTLSIEAKGKDQKEDTPIYFSIIISNNDPTDVFLEYDDRRFSVPVLGNKNLKDVMSLDEIVELNKIFEKEDSEEVAQFGKWLAQRKPKYDEQTPLKSDRFYELVDTSLTSWQSYLMENIKECLYKGDITIPLVRIKDKAKDEGLKTFPTHTAKIKAFLDTYRFRGEKRLGVLYKDKTNKWCIEITISKKDLLGEGSDDIKDIL